MFENLKSKVLQLFAKRGNVTEYIESLNTQDLSRFSEQDIILETEEQIKEFLPDVLGQALARTWIDKRFLDAFYQYPVEVLEKGGVYLPEHISLQFKKEHGARPKVIVYQRQNKINRKLLELKLIMVAEE